MSERELMPSSEMESMTETELDLMQSAESEVLLHTPPELLPVPRMEKIPTRSTALESTLSVELESILVSEPEANPSFVNFPNEAIMMMVGALLVGWLLRSISSKFRPNRRTRRPDRRDGRIQSLEAKLRIALADAEKKGNTIETIENELADARANAEKPENVISEQQELIANLKKNLRYSIIKTRELRAEVADRAVENVRSEVKLRQLEMKLQVAQASTDLSASGAPNYSLAAHPKKERGKPFGGVDKLTRVRPSTIN